MAFKNDQVITSLIGGEVLNRVFVIIGHVVLHIHSNIVNNKQRAKSVYVSTYLQCMHSC